MRKKLVKTKCIDYVDRVYTPMCAVDNLYKYFFKNQFQKTDFWNTIKGSYQISYIA